MVQLGENFWNIRSEFKIFKVLNIGTHMSVVRRENGKYLIIDTVPLDPQLKHEIDELTNNGEDIEAVFATHPFHSLAFPAFHAAYPKVEYFGTPRHRRNLSQIPWKNIEENLSSFLPDIDMRIPAGAEFVNPQPESYNHFNAVWVYTPKSRVIHVDDTIGYIEDAPLLVSPFLKLLGMKPKSFSFHLSLKGPALLPASDAPKLFKQWVEDAIRDWDFDMACCAHNGICPSGAKELLQQTLIDAQPLLDKLAADRSKFEATGEMEEDESVKECSNFNVEGNECG